MVTLSRVVGLIAKRTLDFVGAILASVVAAAAGILPILVSALLAAATAEPAFPPEPPRRPVVARVAAGCPRRRQFDTLWLEA